jgi:hypothetical protein
MMDATASRQSRRVAVIAFVLAMILPPHSASAQGGPGYASAGGAQTFDQSCPGGQGACQVVGTHTRPTIGSVDIDVNTADEMYGYGIGHITSAGARNWATYENVGGTQSNGKTSFKRVCSIDGHTMIGNNQYSTRARHTFESLRVVIMPSQVRTSVLALNMTVQSACSMYHNCSSEYARWECKYVDAHSGIGPPHFGRTLPEPSDPAMYLPATEYVETAEHGFFTRLTAPPTTDHAWATFRDNQYYFFGSSNPPDACAPSCGQQVYKQWADDSDNHEPWSGPSVFSSPAQNLEVVHSTSRQWEVCLNGTGSACSPSCPDHPVLIPYVAPLCQVLSNHCWATAAQSVIYNRTGTEFSQCELVNAALGVSNCPNVGGWAWDISDALDHGGVSSDWEAALTQSTVRSELDAGRPIIFGALWHRRSVVAHSFVMVGYECLPAGKLRLYYYYIRSCPTSASLNTIVANSGVTGTYPSRGFSIIDFQLID